MSHRLLLTIVVTVLVGRTVSGMVPAPAEASTRVSRSIELNGAIRIGGRPASDVRLTFKSSSAQRERRARIKSDGTYRVKLAGDADLVCARVERDRPMNSYENCRRFPAGVHRMDFDFPPGVIRIEVPPSRHRVSRQASVRVESANASAGRSFRLANGFRGDYFAADFGTYVITVTDPERDKLLASWPVTLTSDEPSIGLKLRISRK